MTSLVRRTEQMIRELSRSPGAGALIAGAAAAAIGRRASAQRGSLVPGLLAAGTLGWYFRDSIHGMERAIRSAEDAAVLSAALGTEAPLFGRWAAEADFAGMIARELERGQKVIVECGSGATTLVVASKLRQNGRGRIVSLDHQRVYAARTGRLLDSAGLGSVARVVEAPLRPQQFGNRTISWYDQSVVEDAVEGTIDLLIVDGPPQVEPWARWPALPVFYPLLGANASVLIDDGRTRQTMRTVHSWIDAFPDLDLYWLDTVKGTWLLTRGESSSLHGPLLRLARLLHPRPAGFGRWPVHR
jgi:predicted O-methyltransferase YrrM